MPTAPKEPPYLHSEFPAENNPGLLLTAYRGNLGLDAGIPSSVYHLDQNQIDAGRLKQVGEGKLLKPGETWTLDDGSSVQFVGTKKYVTLSVRHDPGQGIALVAAVCALIGLMGSLFGKRRRIFFRLAVFLRRFGTRQERSRLEVDQRRGHHQELAGDVEIELLHQLDVLEILLRDHRDGDVVDVHLAGANEVQEQIERTLEGIEFDLVGVRRRFEISLFGHANTAISPRRGRAPSFPARSLVPSASPRARSRESGPVCSASRAAARAAARAHR